MSTMQTRPGRGNCGGNFNMLNSLFKASISNACAGESNKQGVKLKDNKASGRHYAKRKSIKQKHENHKSRRNIHPNPNPKGIVSNYCRKK